MAKTGPVNSVLCSYISGRRQTCVVRQVVVGIICVCVLGYRATVTDGVECRKEPGRQRSACVSHSLGLTAISVCQLVINFSIQRLCAVSQKAQSRTKCDS